MTMIVVTTVCVCSQLNSSVFTTPSQREAMEKTGADSEVENVRVNLDSLLLDTSKTPQSVRTPGSKRSVPRLSGGVVGFCSKVHRVLLGPFRSLEIDFSIKGLSSPLIQPIRPVSVCLSGGPFHCCEFLQKSICEQQYFCEQAVLFLLLEADDTPAMLQSKETIPFLVVNHVWPQLSLEG